MSFTAYLQGELPEVLPEISWFDLHRIYSTCPAKWKFEEREVKNSSAIYEHAAILNPADFERAFLREPDAGDYESILVTDNDLKAWLKDKGVAGYSNKKQDELIQLIDRTGESPFILSREKMVKEIEANQRNMKLIPGKDYDRVMKMREVIFSNAEFSELLTDTYNNVMLAGDMDGVDMRISFDAISKSGVIIDYVGATSVREEDFRSQAERGGYYMKQALLYDAFVDAYGQSPSRQLILCQERSSPYIPECYEITERHREIGRIQYKTALQLLKVSQEKEAWPTYSLGAGIKELPISPWYAKQYGLEDK